MIRKNKEEGKPVYRLTKKGKLKLKETFPEVFGPLLEGQKNMNRIREDKRRIERRNKLIEILKLFHRADVKIFPDEKVILKFMQTAQNRYENIKLPPEERLDVSSLSDIVNVKGDETYTQKDGKLLWQADGEDIFYQGTSEKQTPITEKITYYLDGKEMTPEEIAGKSGRVTIHIAYTNHEKVGEVYVPFAAISGMVLDYIK